MHRDPAKRQDLQQGYRRLQHDFIAQRGALRLQNSDVAGLLNINSTTVSEAESSNSKNFWPRYFLSNAVIQAYCKNGGESVIADLEKKAFFTFFPDGIYNIRDLTTYLAYRSGHSLETLGSLLKIDHLNHKTNPKQNASLHPCEILKLRAFLQKELKGVGHLSLPIGELDLMLPDPLVALDNPSANFRENLNLLARLSSGADAASFATIVSKYSGISYGPSTVSAWGKGIGLSKALPHIVTALHSEQSTMSIMTKARSDLLVAIAQTMMPRQPQSFVNSVSYQRSASQAVFDNIVQKC